MGMQCHFHVSDIPDRYKVFKHKDDVKDDAGVLEYVDTYIIINSNSYVFTTNDTHETAWFDIGQMSPVAMEKLKWLIANRICFNAS